MRTVARSGYKHTPDFETQFLPRHRGIRVDDNNNPGFWLQILFDPDDIDAMQGTHVYVVIKHVIGVLGSGDLVAICRRLGTAKRVAGQQRTQLGHGGWAKINMKSYKKRPRDRLGDIVYRLECSDDAVNVFKVKLT